MKRAAFLIALLITVSVLLITIAPAVASPQPENICGPCGSSFSYDASQQGLDVNVTHSTASIQVHQNASATWVVTNRIDESSATQLSEDPELLTRIGREAVSTKLDPVSNDEEKNQFQSASIDDQTVRIQFRDPDVVSQHFGVFVVDYLHSGGDYSGWTLNTDQFSITGPSGTVLLNEFPHTQDGTVMWQRPSEGEDVTRIDGDSDDDDVSLRGDHYIAYGEPGTSSNRVDAALAVASADIWFSNIFGLVVPALLVYGALLTGLTKTRMWTAGTTYDDVDRFSIGIAGIGFVINWIGILFQSIFVVLGLIYLLIGVITLGNPKFLHSIRGAIALGVTIIVAVELIVLGFSFVGFLFEDAQTVLSWIIFYLPIVFAPAFGLAVTQATTESRSRLKSIAIVSSVAAFGLAGSMIVSFDTHELPFTFVFLVVVALGTTIFGLPLAQLAGSRWTNTHSD